jgi:hypothetical protein
MRRRTGRCGNHRRTLVAITLVPVILSTAGCSGLKHEPKLDASLRRYHGDGFTVGYPKGWVRRASERRIVRGSAFEVTDTKTDANRPIGSFDILTYWGGKILLDDVVSDFMRVSRTQHSFELIGQERIDLEGHTGYQVRKESESRVGRSARRLHTVDWFAQLKNGTVVDVRIGFLSDHYDFSIVSSIGRSLAVD